jgi:hypothetical protein
MKLAWLYILIEDVAGLSWEWSAQWQEGGV